MTRYRAPDPTHRPAATAARRAWLASLRPGDLACAMDDRGNLRRVCIDSRGEGLLGVRGPSQGYARRQVFAKGFYRAGGNGDDTRHEWLVELTPERTAMLDRTDLYTQLETLLPLARDRYSSARTRGLMLDDDAARALLAAVLPVVNGAKP